MSTTEADRPTATSALSSVETEAKPTGYGQLAGQTSVLRYRTNTLHDETSELDRSVQIGRLQELTLQKGSNNIRSLLDHLAKERGFSWRTIARMVGVSVNAVNKWRRGEPASGASRRKVAEIAALCEILDACFIDDVASWMEIPILTDVSVTPVDIYSTGRPDLVLDWASQKETRPDVLLESFDRSWHKQEREFETFETEDGNLSIRRKPR